MANLARTSLTTGATPTDATTLTTAAITTTSGRKVLISVFHTKGSSVDATPTPTGACLSSVTQLYTRTNTAGTIRNTVYLANGTGSNSTVVFDWGAATQTGFWWAISEWAGDNLPTIRNVAGTDQLTTDNQSGMVASMTLPAAVGGSGNGYAVVAIVGKASTGGYTADATFTVVNDTGFTGPTLRAFLEYDIGPAANVVAPSWVSTAQWVGGVFEITDEVAGAAQALAGVTAGAATTAGDLAVAHSLDGSSAGAATVTAPLTVAHTLAASTAGAATLAGALDVAHPLAGSTAGAATTAGDLTVAHSLTGSTAGVSTVAGDLTLAGQQALAGLTAGVATVAGALTVAHTLAGSTAGTSGASGTLGLTVDLPAFVSPLVAVVADSITRAVVANDGTTSVEVPPGG